MLHYKFLLLYLNVNYHELPPPPPNPPPENPPPENPPPPLEPLLDGVDVIADDIEVYVERIK